LGRAIGSNWVLNAVQIGVFMVLSPLIVSSLGKEMNGVWVTIASLTGYLQLLILGVPMASVRFIAEHVARADEKRTNEAISTCLGILLTLGGATLLVGALLFGAFELGYLRGDDWILDAASRRDARVAFAIVVVQIAFGFAGKLPNGIFDAHREFVVKNVILAASFLLKLGLAYLLLTLDASCTSLAWVLVGCMVFEFAVSLLVIRRRHPELRFGLGSFRRGLVLNVLSFSVFALLLNVGSKLAFQTDALVIGAFQSAARVTPYDIGNKVFDPLTNVVLAIAMVVMPTTTVLMARRELGGMVDLLLKWSKIAFSIVLLVGVYLLIVGPAFLSWWFGGEYESVSGDLVRILTASFLLFLPIRGVALPMLMGMGKPGRPAVALLAMGLLNLFLSIALIGPLDLFGVALGTAIPNVLFAATVLFLACRELGCGIGRYLGYVAGRAVPGALVPAGFLWSLDRAVGLESFTELFLAGVATCALFAIVWIGFVYRGDPYLDPWARLRARMVRAGGADSR
jgi:O-antigen/teichoic acid export membrane protein